MSFRGNTILGQPFVVTCRECGKKIPSYKSIDYAFCDLECKEISENEIKPYQDPDYPPGYSEKDYCEACGHHLPCGCDWQIMLAVIKERKNHE